MRAGISKPGPAIEMKYSKTPKGKIRIEPILGKKLPDGPGVYFIVSKDNPKNVFYVGETKKIAQRVRYTFRCPKTNPSPCSLAYKLAYSTPPSYKDFCKKFCVSYLETNTMVGRLEIEEHYQKKHGTNKADFYKKWEP
jgi:hypothetical protein